uniref:Uncharacterized protein n=1 Tax=Anguilla anguilla TaxID=7936 RepID=A0A0E9WUW1_ANGAN
MYMASPSVPQTRHWSSTSRLFTDRVWLGNMCVVSRWPLLESPLNQPLVRDRFPSPGATALRDMTLVFRPPCKKDGTEELVELSQCNKEPSSEHVNKWSVFDGWKWTSHISAECASIMDKGIVPRLTSHRQSIPSCPPLPQCAAGWDVGLHSAEELYSQSGKGYVRVHCPVA